MAPLSTLPLLPAPGELELVSFAVDKREAEEVIGRPVPFISAEHLAALRSSGDYEALARDESGLEVRHERKDSTLVDVLLATGVLRDAIGKPTGYIGVFTDLTEHKTLEAQLRQAQKMEAVGQLAGGIAHDFNNLLTVITSYSGLLRAELAADDPKRADVQQIGGAAARAAALTRQLLAFSRQQMLRPEVLVLNSVVAGLEQMLRRLVREDIAIVTALAPGLGAVEADPGQVEQVIVNLVVNARDTMPNGGALTIETANVVFDNEYLLRHSETAVRPGRYVMLAVTDTGAGMPFDVQARVFKPFYTTKAPGHGTGMGLSTVYGIVKQSGGYMWLYSEPGQGTVFKVYLPRADAEPESENGVQVSVARSAGHETVLVVEDDTALRTVTCRTIRRHGYQVIEARTGLDALEICEQYDGPIHLVVTDLVMPEMSGDELVKRIAVRHPEIKVLLMSGYTRDVLTRQRIVRARSAFIEKPFTVEQLAAKVRDGLDDRQSGSDR